MCRPFIKNKKGWTTCQPFILKNKKQGKLGT
jgi:hypothetical protein